MPTITKETYTIKNQAYRAAGNFVVVAGQTLNVESSPGGGEFFEDVCPEGKHWNVNMILYIEEHDE